MAKYNRREPIDCAPLDGIKSGWFYVNQGSITVVIQQGHRQARLTRRQLLDALPQLRRDDGEGRGVTCKRRDRWDT